jgi:hypothetical protein
MKSRCLSISTLIWHDTFFSESVGHLWVRLRYARSIMTELSATDSFIVRIYRFDTEDQRKLTGLVESMDGAGERLPFTDMDELAAILNRCVRPRKRRGKTANQFRV